MAAPKGDDLKTLKVLRARDLVTLDQYKRLAKALEEGQTLAGAMRKTPLVDQADFMVAKGAGEAEALKAAAQVDAEAGRGSRTSGSSAAIPKLSAADLAPPPAVTAATAPVSAAPSRVEVPPPDSDEFDELMDSTDYEVLVPIEHATPVAAPAPIEELDPDLELEIEYEEPATVPPPGEDIELADLEMPGIVGVPGEKPQDAPVSAASDSDNLMLGGALNSALWDEEVPEDEAPDATALDSRREIPEGFVAAPEGIDVNELDPGYEEPVFESVPAAEPPVSPPAEPEPEAEPEAPQAKGKKNKKKGGEKKSPESAVEEEPAPVEAPPAPPAPAFERPTSSEGYATGKGGKLKVFTLADDEGIALIGRVNAILSGATGRSSGAVRFVVKEAGSFVEELDVKGLGISRDSFEKEELEKLVNRVKVMATIQPWKKGEAKGAFRVLDKGMEFTAMVETGEADGGAAVTVYLVEGRV